MNQTYTYLDWNVLNKIEKIESLDDSEKNIFLKIEQHVLYDKTIVPYSNAHIHDLKRGYEKSPTFTEGHLSTLKRLTKDLLIVQYWGNEKVVWEYRDPIEFFNSSLEEDHSTPATFTDLGHWDTTGLLVSAIQMLDSIPLPENFHELFKADSVFDRLFPTAKIKLTVLSFCEDLYAFNKRSKTDYALYKSLRKFVNDGLDKTKIDINILKQIDSNLSLNSSREELHEAARKHYKKSKTSDNSEYDLILTTYSNIDMLGYNSDDRFHNMIDDGLHTFYAAHCNYFVSLDEKCRYKAKETYKKHNIVTEVLTPEQYVSTVIK